MVKSIVSSKRIRSHYLSTSEMLFTATVRPTQSRVVVSLLRPKAIIKSCNRPKINSTTIDNEIGYKSLRALSSKKRKLVRESTVQQFCKPPRSKLIPKKCFTSTRNNQSVVTMKKAKLLKKKGFRVLKNPEIIKLAPFSTSLVTGKKTTCGYSASATPNNRQSFGTPSCLKSIAERNKILKEIENLSKALLSQQGRFQMAVEKIKAERKKHKKTK